MPRNLTRIYPDVYDATAKRDAGTPIEYAAANLLQKRLYCATRYLLRTLFDYDKGNHLPAEPKPYPHVDVADAEVEKEEIRFGAIYGQLVHRGYGVTNDPSNGRLARGALGRGDEDLTGTAHAPGSEPDPANPTQNIPFRVVLAAEFRGVVSDAVRYYNEHAELFKQVWIQLYEHGQGKANGAPGATTVRAKQLAEVTFRLVTRSIDPADPHIRRHVINAIDQSLGGVAGATPSTIDVSLPDLDAGTSDEIIADNLRAVQVIYFSSQLEEMKLHAAVAKLVEHFTTGMLPITRGAAADRLYAWIKNEPQRLTEFERRGIYGRVLGLAQGGTRDILPNREFSDLWYRFLSTVSVKYREIFSFERDEVSAEQIHKAGRDLAVNLSLHGYGIAHPAAIEMQGIAMELMAICDEPAIQSAYGVRDRWQLVERIGALYLGGSANGVKYRTMASAGEKIIKWIADRADVLASGSAAGLPIVTIGANGQRSPTADFRQLADLAERWLAVTGTADAQVREQSDPIDLPLQQTLPTLGQTALSQDVQDALRQAGGVLPNLTPNLGPIGQA